jgi:Putative transposase
MRVADGTATFTLVLHTWTQDLRRFSHRTAVGNERIWAIDQGEVVFTVRADEHGGKRRVRLDGAEFVRRFLLHVLPGGIKRIRHHGVLASDCKSDRLQAARTALRMSPANQRAIESAQAFMQRVARMDVRV